MRYVLALIGLCLCAPTWAQQSTLGNVNTSTFGATNYYANDLPGNTNGPLVLYRLTGSGGISNLWEDTVLGTTAAAFKSWSLTPGDAAYGAIIMATAHDGYPPSPTRTEFEITSGNHIALLPAGANAISGHIQIGNLVPVSSGYGTYNMWMYMQDPVFALAQANATNFSPAIVWRCSELQGANSVTFYPGILSYTITTNAPGKFGFMITSDYGGNGTQVWDANTAKAGRWIDYQCNPTHFALNYSGFFHQTNHATVGFNPDPTYPAMEYFPTNITSGIVLLNALTNVDVTGTKWFDFTCVITNSHGSGGPFAIVLPANVRTNIAGTVLQLTNMTYVRFSGIGGLFTNGFGQPQY